MLIDIFEGHAFFGEAVFMLLCLAAAFMTGRSIANEWKPLWQLVVAGLVLGLTARFLHFALYEAQFLSLSRYIVDTIPIMIATWLGYQFTRTNQMTQQYHWQYEKASPLSWREKRKE
jgi:small-conductance mechanosensitive channel